MFPSPLGYLAKLFLRNILLHQITKLLKNKWSLRVHKCSTFKSLQILAMFCSDSVLKNAANDFKKMGQRIFIFIIGGATRSEVIPVGIPLLGSGFVVHGT